MCLKRLLHLLLLQEPLSLTTAQIVASVGLWQPAGFHCAALTWTQITLLGLNHHFQTSTSLKGLHTGKIMAQGAPVPTSHVPTPHFMSGCI